MITSPRFVYRARANEEPRRIIRWQNNKCSGATCFVPPASEGWLSAWYLNWPRECELNRASRNKFDHRRGWTWVCFARGDLRARYTRVNWSAYLYRLPCAFFFRLLPLTEYSRIGLQRNGNCNNWTTIRSHYIAVVCIRCNNNTILRVIKTWLYFSPYCGEIQRLCVREKKRERLRLSRENNLCQCPANDVAADWTCNYVNDLP